jgi:hypothetical protein
MKKIQTEIQTILNKLSKRQLQKICKRMGIKCPKRKRVIVNKLLQPLGAKYKIVNLLLSKITLAPQAPQVPDYSDEYIAILDEKIENLDKQIKTLDGKDRRGKDRREKKEEKIQSEKKLCIINAVNGYSIKYIGLLSKKLGQPLKVSNRNYRRPDSKLIISDLEKHIVLMKKTNPPNDRWLQNEPTAVIKGIMTQIMTPTNIYFEGKDLSESEQFKIRCSRFNLKKKF